MTSRDFAYWLQGYFEILQAGATDAHVPLYPPLSAKQVECIKRHLEMVFIHEIDPAAGPNEHQAKLDEAHAPKPPSGIPSGSGGNPFGPVFRC